MRDYASVVSYRRDSKNTKFLFSSWESYMCVWTRNTKVTCRCTFFLSHTHRHAHAYIHTKDRLFCGGRGQVFFVRNPLTLWTRLGGGTIATAPVTQRTLASATKMDGVPFVLTFIGDESESKSELHKPHSPSTPLSTTHHFAWKFFNTPFPPTPPLGEAITRTAHRRLRGAAHPLWSMWEAAWLYWAHFNPRPRLIDVSTL